MELSNAKRQKELEKENAELKKIWAESMLKNRVLSAEGLYLPWFPSHDVSICLSPLKKLKTFSYIVLIVEKSKNYISNLDIFRAIATLSVCMIHFRSNDVLEGTLLNTLMSNGHLGVQIFFVISGYVIPLSMHRSRFQWSATHNFLVRRFFRLYPPYAIATVFGIVVWYASFLFGFIETPPNTDVRQILTNFTLTCSFFHTNWLNPVAWTLAIEAQYYILICLFYPFFLTPKNFLKIFTCLIWIATPLIVEANIPIISSFTAIFFTGILLFMKEERFITEPYFWILLILSVSCEINVSGLKSGLTILMTALSIMYLPNFSFKPLLFVGKISFSLYLIHNIIGGKIIKLSLMLPDLWYIRLFSIFVATLVSILVSYIFYKYIEKTSHDYAKSLKNYFWFSCNYDCSNSLSVFLYFATYGRYRGSTWSVTQHENLDRDQFQKAYYDIAGSIWEEICLVKPAPWGNMDDQNIVRRIWAETLAPFDKGYRDFKIGVLLRQAREEAGLTQEEIAIQMRTEKSAISRIENRSQDIRLSTLDKYATALGKNFMC